MRSVSILRDSMMGSANASKANSETFHEWRCKSGVWSSIATSFYCLLLATARYIYCISVHRWHFKGNFTWRAVFRGSTISLSDRDCRLSHVQWVLSNLGTNTVLLICAAMQSSRHCCCATRLLVGQYLSSFILLLSITWKANFLS